MNMTMLYYTRLIIYLVLSTWSVFCQSPHSCPKKANNRTCSAASGHDKYVRIRNYICDTKTDGGGWIVFQRRIRKDTSFDRSWSDYKYGFGGPCGDYWLGNEFLYHTTSSGPFGYELRVDMTYNGKEYYQQYKQFYVRSEDQKYELIVNAYNGNAGNMLTAQSFQKFSTPDRDNDANQGHCAATYKAGWWFGNNPCHYVLLNGEFDKNYGLTWGTLTGENSSLTSVEMKTRIHLKNPY